MAPSDLNFLHTSCPFVPRCRSSPVLGQLRGARLVQVPPQFPSFLLLNPQTCSQLLLFFILCPAHGHTGMGVGPAAAWSPV